MTTYTGRPCKNCGNTIRWKSNRTCVTCQRDYKRNWEQENKKHRAAYERKRYRKMNKVKCKNCGILLGHPDTLDCGDTCGDCAGKVKRFRDLNPYRLEDYQPFVVEY